MADYAELLTCAVCLDIYKVPVTLSCLHSFCKQCIDSYSKNQQTINCPLCRMTTEVNSIKDDFRIAEFIGLLKTFENKTEKPFNCCDLCDVDIEPIEVHLCKDCGKVLCMHCRMNHEKDKRTKIHTVYALSSKSIPYCKKHNKKLEFYCNDTKCKKFLCVICALLFHDSHDKITIQQQIEIVTNDIAKSVEIIKANTESVRSYLDFFRNNEFEIKEKFKQIDFDACKRRDHMITQAIEAYQQQSMAMKKEESEMLGKVRDNIVYLEKIEKNLSHFIEHTVSNLEKKSFFDVNEIHIEIKELLESEIDLQIVEIEKMELISNVYDKFNIKEQIHAYITPAEVNAIKHDFRTAELVSFYKSFESAPNRISCCDECKKHTELDEVHICKNCQTVLCRNCCLNHKTHIVHALNSQHASHCKEHNEKLKYVCNDPQCKKLFCASCILQSHSGHDFRTIEEQKERIKCDIKKHSENLKKPMEQLRTDIMTERYSFSITTFSPLGKLVQIEYALSAVAAGAPSVAIKARDGAVIATEKKYKSNLYDEHSISKVEVITPEIGMVYSGMGPDYRVLVKAARKIAQKYKLMYDMEIPTIQLAQRVAEVMQEYTQSGGVRPFGVSLLIAGWNTTTNGPMVFQCDPSVCNSL